MDEFAQSREDDDLFADEFEPASALTAVVEPPTQSYTESREAPGYNEASNIKPAPNNGRHNGGERQDRGGRGGNNRGRRGGGEGLAGSRYAPMADNVIVQVPVSKPQGQPQAPIPAPQATPAEVGPEKLNETPSDDAPAPSSAPTSGPVPSAQAPDPSASIANNRTPAVRGDRSLTGGPSKKKLTEDELTLKMEKMAILNAQKSEKHRLTELDQAQFQNREKEMAKERREREQRERRERAGMEAERMRNRERKLKGMGGREWDEGKEEMMAEEAKRGRSSEYVRGGHGGVIRGKGAGLAGSAFAGSAENGDGESGRGKGTFNIRGRGARGRGGWNPRPPKDEGFPSLPTPAKKVDGPVLVSAKDSGYSDVRKLDLGRDEKPHDWAEEMATPVEEKRVVLEPAEVK